MRFDFCIGNPPYNQEFTDEGNRTFASPVYNDFIDAATCVADKVELIHPARFLFNAGSTPKAWNLKMLSDPHFKVLHYEEDATVVFPNTDIKGGVAITYHDNKKEFGAIHIFTKFPELNTIVTKVTKKMKKSLSEIIYTQNRFDLEKLYFEHPELREIIGSKGKDRRFRNNIFDRVNVFLDNPENKNDISTVGVVKNKRVKKYINSEYVDMTHENINKWKTLVARANGSGKFGDALSSPIILKPHEAYTQTFIGIGSFDSSEEAENASKYIKTRFVRALLGVLKVTQDNDREVWRMVPLQDYSDKSDINWKDTINNIDIQLFKKYELSEKEIEFINKNVKEMV